MAIVKSKLLKQLSENYPNFLKKDLEKFTNIILNEIKFFKKSIAAINDEKKNKNIKGYFKITELIEFIIQIASRWLIFLNECITKKENYLQKFIL